jgi:hypothetical protein
MLPQFCDCPDDAIGCCQDLADTAEGILSAAWGGLLACAGSDCCAPIYRCIGVAEPHLMTQDYLAVWVSRVARVGNRSQQLRSLQFASTQGTFRVKLIESGYPTLATNATEIHEPTTEAINFAARHSLAHGEAIYRAVLDHVHASDTCGTVKGYEDLTPVPPSAGLVGWTFSVVLEL